MRTSTPWRDFADARTLPGSFEPPAGLDPGALPEHVAVRVLLQQRLAEVLAEQDSRSRAA